VKGQLGELAYNYVSKDKGGFEAPGGSIMHFDLPASYSDNPDDKHGMDKKLYPPPEFSYLHLKADQPDRGNSKKIDFQQLNPLNHRSATALNTIDLDKSKNWRILCDNVHVVSKNPNDPNQHILLRGWADTILWNATLDVLGFESSDKRVWTGSLNYQEFRVSPNGDIGHSLRRDVRLPFRFDSAPPVLAFISGFDTGFGADLKIQAAVIEHTVDVFSIVMGALDSKAVLRCRNLDCNTERGNRHTYLRPARGLDSISSE
jgi:hypothetical protein